MRTFLITIMFLFYFISCKRQEYKKIIDTYSTGEILTEYLFTNKVDTSNYIVNGYYKSGQIKFKGKVQNGKFIGEKNYYYENGKVKEIDSLFTPCSLDKYECDMLIKRFYENGIIREIFSLKNEKYNDTAFLFDSSGRLKRKFETKNGKKNGIAIEYYKNGLVASKENYVNDSLENFSIYFNENGDTLKMISNNQKEKVTQYFEKLNDSIILRGLIPERGYVSWTWENKSGKVLKRLRKKGSFTISPPVLPL